jgi:hypothetical protein
MDPMIAVSVLSPMASMLFALFAFRRGQKNDDSSAGREMGQVLTEIGYIKSQMDNLSRKLEAHEERWAKMGERVAIIEQSAKSAHHRLDRMAEGG